MKRAHDLLIETQYLSAVEWLDAPDANDWKLQYHIGKRARAEYEKNKSEIRTTVALPPRRRKTSAQLSFPERENGAESVDKLVSRGISRKTAQKLSREHSGAKIEHKITVFDWLKENRPEKAGKNPAGFLRKSIEEDWSDPSGFATKDEKQKAQKRKRPSKAREQLSELQTEFAKIENFLNADHDGQIETLYTENVFGWFRKEHNRLPESDADKALLRDYSKKILPGQLKARKERMGDLEKRMQGLSAKINSEEDPEQNAG